MPAGRIRRPRRPSSGKLRALQRGRDRVTESPGPYDTQHEAIRQEFGRQAERWSRDEIDGNLLWAVDRFGLRPGFSVLDVAAGTGLLARAIAPRVTSVVALDLTPAMLAHGRRCAERDGIENLRFDEGAAEAL